jgi:hypothetical protein
MYQGQTVFSQLVQQISRYTFNQCVAGHRGHVRVRSFSCWDQFLCMVFAQLTGRHGLRDIEVCLNSQREKLYHMGFRGRISRTTLADANATRDFQIYQDVGCHLIDIARGLYAGEPLALELANTVYALDSTTVDLCLSLFPWAHFCQTKAAIKIHTLLDLRGSIPAFVCLTDGKVHDVGLLDAVPVEADAIVTLDRGYLDFARLYRLHQIPAYFVLRAKRNLCCRRVDSRPVDKTTGLRADQTIVLTGKKSRRAYPEPLRRVSYIDGVRNKRLVFLTNHFGIPALTVAEIYKQRWQVELFFKWVKQHLRIQTFYGTSANAVKTQVWIAISAYLLVAIAKKRLHLPASLHTLLHIVEVNLFEKTPLCQLVTSALAQKPDPLPSNQLNLFDP